MKNQMIHVAIRAMCLGVTLSAVLLTGKKTGWLKWIGWALIAILITTTLLAVFGVV